eukprot:5905787-Prymnesium_polylepis.1
MGEHTYTRIHEDAHPRGSEPKRPEEERGEEERREEERREQQRLVRVVIVVRVAVAAVAVVGPRAGVDDVGRVRRLRRRHRHGLRVVVYPHRGRRVGKAVEGRGIAALGGGGRGGVARRRQPRRWRRARDGPRDCDRGPRGWRGQLEGQRVAALVAIGNGDLDHPTRRLDAHVLRPRGEPRGE